VPVNQQDEESFREFVAARMGKLRGVAFLACGDRHKADDAVSAALVKLYANWSRIANPHHYATRVVMNAAVDELRRPWRRERSTETGLLDLPRADASDAYGEREHLRQALMRVPAGQRTVLVLRYFDDLTVEEIAEVLRRRPGTVRSQCARGLTALRRAMSDLDVRAGYDFEKSDLR
jgi:RNA polymerase sigma-70 factor (sigma-E family)